MGWWEEERNGVSVDIGDDPLDAIGAAWTKILRAYKRDLKRKPTPEEIAAILETSIKACELDLFADMDERELEAVEVRLRNRSPRQKPKEGDYFAVPLSTGGYGFGQIKSMYRDYSILVDFLHKRSDSLLSVPDLTRAPVMFECMTGTYGFELDQWLLVGNVPVPPDTSGMKKKELHSYLITKLGSYGHEAARKVLEWYIGGMKGPKPYGR